MTIEDPYKRITELERQLRIEKEEKTVLLERSETLRKMLMEVNNELTNMLSDSNMGVVCLDQQLRIESVTPGIRVHFHIRDEDIGRPLTDLSSDLVYDNFENDIKEVIASSTLKEIVVPTQDGKWFSIRISPHLQVDGKIIGAIISMADITHLKDKEEQLKEKSEIVLTAIQKSPIVIWVQDRDLRYIWVHNPHPGFNPTEVVGKRDKDLLPPHEAEHLTKIKQQVLDTGKGAREKVTTTIQGVTYYYDLAVEPLADEAAKIVGVSCASMEISEEEYDLYKK